MFKLKCWNYKMFIFIEWSNLKNCSNLRKNKLGKSSKLKMFWPEKTGRETKKNQLENKKKLTCPRVCFLRNFWPVNNIFWTYEHFPEREFKKKKTVNILCYVNDFLVWTFMLFEHFFKMNIYVIWTIFKYELLKFERFFNMNNYIIWYFQIKLVF
jgi:hypothetical protein